MIYTVGATSVHQHAPLDTLHTHYSTRQHLTYLQYCQPGEKGGADSPSPHSFPDRSLLEPTETSHTTPSTTPTALHCFSFAAHQTVPGIVIGAVALETSVACCGSWVLRYRARHSTQPTQYVTRLSAAGEYPLATHLQKHMQGLCHSLHQTAMNGEGSQQYLFYYLVTFSLFLRQLEIYSEGTTSETKRNNAATSLAPRTLHMSSNFSIYSTTDRVALPSYSRISFKSNGLSVTFPSILPRELVAVIKASSAASSFC